MFSSEDASSGTIRVTLWSTRFAILWSKRYKLFSVAWIFCLLPNKSIFDLQALIAFSIRSMREQAAHHKSLLKFLLRVYNFFSVNHWFSACTAYQNWRQKNFRSLKSKSWYLFIQKRKPLKVPERNVIIIFLSDVAALMQFCFSMLDAWTALQLGWESFVEN